VEGSGRGFSCYPHIRLEELRKTTENFRPCGVLGRHLNRTLPEFKPEALLRYIQYHAIDISHLTDHQPNLNVWVVKLCKGSSCHSWNVETHARSCLLTSAVNRKKGTSFPSHRDVFFKSWYSFRDWEILCCPEINSRAVLVI